MASRFHKDVSVRGRQDSKKLYEVEDSTFKDAGKVGLWAKADSVIYFDDLRVTAK